MERLKRIAKAVLGDKRRAGMMCAFMILTLIVALCLQDPAKGQTAWLRWLFIGSILLLGLVAIRFATLSGKMERSFLIIALAFGLLMVFITPAMSGPDEATHFARAYATAGGQLFPHGKVSTPADFYLMSRNLGMQTGGATYETVQGLGWNQTDISATGGYSFLGYIPSAIGILIAKLIGLPAIGYLYLGRFTNLIAYVLLAWAAIKITPKLKATFYITALLPMAIYLAADFSIDGILLGLALLSLALFVRLWNAEDHSAGLKDIILLCLPVLAATVVKFYFIGPFLLLLVPKRVFKDKKGSLSRYWLLAILLAITVAWQLYAMRVETARSPAVPGADAGAQLAYIFSHPLQYLRMLGETFITRLNQYVLQLGTVGKLSLTLNIVATASPIFAVLIFALDGMEKELNRGRKFAIAAMILVEITFIFTALYLDWTPVGARVAEGVQGRYFLPALPLIALLIHVKSAKMDKEKLGHLAQTGGFFIIAGTAMMMVMNYY